MKRMDVEEALQWCLVATIVVCLLWCLAMLVIAIMHDCFGFFKS